MYGPAGQNLWDVAPDDVIWGCDSLTLLIVKPEILVELGQCHDALAPYVTNHGIEQAAWRNPVFHELQTSLLSIVFSYLVKQIWYHISHIWYARIRSTYIACGVYLGIFFSFWNQKANSSVWGLSKFRVGCLLEPYAWRMCNKWKTWMESVTTHGRNGGVMCKGAASEPEKIMEYWSFMLFGMQRRTLHQCH